MHIDVIIDVVCPWCYVGKKELDLAVETFAGTHSDITITYHPYQLAPDAPLEGVDRATYYDQKFGKDSPQLQTMRHYLLERGKQLGISFDFESPCLIANTMDCHRLIKWAQHDGVQDKLVDALMAAYFEGCQFLGDHNLLLQIASECGMNEDIVKDLLKGDADKAMISQSVSQAHALGVRGVPFFIFDKKRTISGAEPAKVLQSVLTSLM